MSVAGELSTLLDGLSRLGAQQWALRLVALAAPFVVLLAETGAGAPFPAGFLLLMVPAALMAAALPDSQAGLVLMLLLVVHWAVRIEDETSAWVLLAALALLVLQVALTLASYGPPSLQLDVALLRRWLDRSMLTASVTALVWLAARLATGLGLPASGWVVGAALLLVTAWAVFLSRRLLLPPGQEIT